MASPLNAALAALVATVLWTSLGYALARHLLPRALAAGASPVLGWAVHSAVTLPLFTLIGFTSSAVVTVAALCVIAAVLSFRFTASGDDEAAVMIPPWTFAAAALLALAPAVAIVPKFSGGAVHLADPIFDHSKIAIIDAIGRQGLPPVDPVFGAAGGYGQFFYYYLWHYSAAELAVTLRVSGWEADIALTWFTAFASLCLLMGACGVARQKARRRDLGCLARRRNVTARHIELDFRLMDPRTVSGRSDRIRRLAVSVRVGAAACDVGGMRA